MKKLICTTILTVLMASAAVAGRQDNPEEYLGLPGDNLNLYAVMKLFQESETLEAFERSLNDENSRINNLDLNNDGYVDYLTVSDYVNGEDHTIVLRSVLDRNESQDVAVFTVEKLRNGEVRIQLIGDEALYGRNYIVEPIYAETPNPGYRGRTVYRDNVTVVTTTYYEVAAWPVIRFIYAPYYSIWRSNWYWGYYPAYYRPWRPFYWHAYYGYHSHWYPTYYSHYRHWNEPRWHHYHDYYYSSVRAYSPKVSHRITEGTYRQTYSRPDTRRDGDELYARTEGTRGRSAGNGQSATGSDRRSSAATGSRSTGNPAAVQNGESRRTSTPAQNRSDARPAATDRRGESTPAATQGSSSRRVSTGTVKSAPASTGSSRSNSTVRTSQPPAGSRQSEGAPATRTQSSTSRSSSAPAARTQSSSSRSSSTVSSRSNSSSSRSSSAPAARTQSSSRSSSAPAARSQGSSGRSSATVSSRSNSSSSRSSSGAPSRSSSRSSSSSKGSDESRSSRR
ncbi:MAG: hypothetical protein QUS66_10570 [Bacteroidota bacterium]|nr:hypothetical protein [Bacteroidota bacterium]